MSENFADIVKEELGEDTTVVKALPEQFVTVGVSMKKSERKMLRQLALDADTTITGLVRSWVNEHYERDHVGMTDAATKE